MNNNHELSQLLSFDSLAEAERITGESYHNSSSTVALGIALMQENRHKKESILKSNLDSTHSNSLEYYQSVIAEEGFEKVLEIPLNASQDFLFLYWHPDGILLCFDTYFNGKSINGGHFYYNWNPADNLPDRGAFTSSGSWRDGVLIGDHDAREAIRFKIRRLRENGKFLSLWIERPFLWLLGYTDTKVEGYDYKAINEQRISMLPEHVRKAITPEGK